MTQKHQHSTKSASAPKVIVFGLLEGQRKAAWFAGQHVNLAAKAAKQLDLKVVPIINGHAADLLKRLAQGRVHANGRSFLPTVRKDIYERVVAFAGSAAGQGGGEAGAGAPEGSSGAGAAGGGAGSPPSAFPRSWQEIVVGHLVIAQETEPSDGWWEAIVISVDGDRLTLHIPSCRKSRATAAPWRCCSRRSRSHPSHRAPLLGLSRSPAASDGAAFL